MLLRGLWEGYFGGVVKAKMVAELVDGFAFLYPVVRRGIQ